ncbi:hypothetical protein Taro_047154 [Colocasia esculenta]|uniref:Non-haem dioxygenase N-terminal domain-containing protein n=1 Tax=Colocasia esculenta TaxID=4460 RepID=A0A843X6D8_COLES|nr:hypothetical protein [Colocasia esculenta]
MASGSRPGGGGAFRVPPPTPIATGKGTRSAAVNDRVLADYLERSLRVPELTLPDPSSLGVRRNPTPAKIELGVLLAGDAASRGRLLSSAAAVGAFLIDGHGVTEGDVGAAVEVAAGVFGLAEEKRGALGPYFRRRGGAREELRWLRPPGAEDEAVLRGAWPDSYPAFREKLENMCSKLDSIAESIGTILSANMGTPHGECPAEESPPSVLCLRKYSFDAFRNPISTAGSGEAAPAASPPRALSLHLLGSNREFVIKSDEEGSVPFPVPTGSIVVTLSKELQDMSNREFKGVDGEPIYELSSDLGPSFSMEYRCFPASLRRRTKHSTARSTLSLRDQLLVALALILLYKLWVWISGS